MDKHYVVEPCFGTPTFRVGWSRDGAVVHRTYGDFVFLHKAVRHAYAALVVPPLYDVFKTAESPCADATRGASRRVAEEILWRERSDDAAIKYAKSRNLQRFLRRVARHEILESSEIFKAFVSMTPVVRWTRFRYTYNSSLDASPSRATHGGARSRFRSSSSASSVQSSGGGSFRRNDTGDSVGSDASADEDAGVRAKRKSNRERSEMWRQLASALSVSMRTSDLVRRAQSRLGDSIAALAINASPCIKTSNLLHRFGHFLERSSDEDGGGDGVLFANSMCALSMLEDAAERDALIETESDVSDRMQRYRDAYLVAEDELRRANAALCGRRLRKMEARGDATGSGEGGGALDAPRLSSDDDAEKQLSRVVDELSVRAFSKLDSSNTAREVLSESLRRLRSDMNDGLVSTLRRTAISQCSIASRRVRELQELFKHAYGTDVGANVDNVSTTPTRREEAINLCIVEARCVPANTRRLVVRIAVSGAITRTARVAEAARTEKDGTSTSSVVHSGLNNLLLSGPTVRSSASSEFLFGQTFSFRESSRSMQDASSRLFRLEAKDKDTGESLGTALVALDVVLGDGDKWIDVVGRSGKEERGLAIRIRATTTTTTTTSEAGGSRTDELGFRESPSYAGMAHLRSLSTCAERENARRWLAFGGGGSLDAAVDRFCKETEANSKATTTCPRTLSFLAKSLVWGGVPRAHRRRVWLVLSGASRRKCGADESYAKVSARKSDDSVVAAIEADLVRTFAGHATRINREEEYAGALKRVLVAHANRNSSIGYSQGLNHVAGFLLCVPGVDEEDAFWILCAMTERLCAEYYTPSMPGLRRDFRVMRELAHCQLPDVLRHMDKVGAPLAVIVTGSWLSHFVLHLPSHTLVRLMDVSMWMGSAALMLAVLALMRMHKDHILRAQSLARIKEIWQEFEKRCYDADTFMIAMHHEWQSLDRGEGSMHRISSLRSKHARLVV
eukprot:g3254.t1